MANKTKGAGLYQDRNSMGKLPMSQKMTDYFPQQYNPYNPDNYYAGDVADGTAQRMEGAALRRGVHDAQTDIDGRAIDANKPQAQMREGGLKQKYKISTTTAKETNVKPGKDGISLQVGTIGGPNDKQTEVTKAQDLKTSGLSPRVQELAKEYLPTKSSQSTSSPSNKSRTTTFYTKDDAGTYSHKKKEFELRLRSESGEDKSTRTFTKYGKDGQIKKQITAESGTKKFKRLGKKQERHLKRGRKRDLSPSQARKDDAKLADEALKAKLKYDKNLGRTPLTL